MLGVSDPYKTRKSTCISLELESGKISDRYLGHSAQVKGFSTSQSDPNVFLTACGDGYARLYDTRHHLPMLTFDVGQQSSVCSSAIPCHSDGILSA